jgi:hypothetical protein
LNLSNNNGGCIIVWKRPGLEREAGLEAERSSKILEKWRFLYAG